MNFSKMVERVHQALSVVFDDHVAVPVDQCFVVPHNQAVENVADDGVKKAGKLRRAAGAAGCFLLTTVVFPGQPPLPGFSIVCAAGRCPHRTGGHTLQWS